MQRISYKLINIESTLWKKREDIGENKTWKEDSTFFYSGIRGSVAHTFDYIIGSQYDVKDNDGFASAPWRDTTKNSHQGDIFLDPAMAWSLLFNFTISIDLNYTYNPYIQ